MKQQGVLVCALAAVALFLIGCHGGNSSDVTGSNGTQITIQAQPNLPYVGATVALFVRAYNDHLALKSLAIDFTGDGTWDETRTFDRSSIAAVFTHAYDSAGTFRVGVQVIDENDLETVQTLLLEVSPQTNVPITYAMYGSSRQGGDCGIIGPPALCVGCSALLGNFTSPGLTRSLGAFPRGTPVSVFQTFAQTYYTGGRLPYSCNFMMNLLAGDPGHLATLATGTCTTSTMDSSGRMNCYISVEATVP